MEKYFNFIFIVLLLSACVKSYDPEYKVDKETVRSEIHKIIDIKDFCIKGYKIPIDDTLDVYVAIQLINANNLPANNDSLMQLQKRVASKVKSLLKRTFQYRSYDVIFLRRDTIKGILGKVTSEEGLYPKRFYVRDL